MNLIHRRFKKYYTESSSGCWNWTASIQNSGYGKFRVGDKMMSSHRVSYLIYKGEIPENMNVCHKCDNKLCVNPDHLFLGSQADNIRDKIKKGRQTNGEKAWNAKLTKTQVKVIREAHKNGFQMKQIRDYFKISWTSISNIINKKRWGHV